MTRRCSRRLFIGLGSAATASLVAGCVDELGLGGDGELTLGIDAPPQISRHAGYETAILEMSRMELTVS